MLKSKAADMPTVPHPVSMQETFQDSIARATGRSHPRSTCLSASSPSPPPHFLSSHLAGGEEKFVEAIPYARKRGPPASDSGNHFDKRGRGRQHGNWRGRGRGRRDVRTEQGNSQQDGKQEHDAAQQGSRNDDEIEIDEDLEDPELLSKIAEAVNPEELKQVSNSQSTKLALQVTD
eukprot:137613-Hanusia_phi.AAC.2